MDRGRQPDDSFAFADFPAGATDRRGRERVVAQWLLALSALVGFACLMLAAGLAVARPDVQTGREARAEPGHASHLPRDGEGPADDEGPAALDSENDDDDKDDSSDSSAASPFSRSVASSEGARVASRSRASADTEQPLVSTGLARGPPLAI